MEKQVARIVANPTGTPTPLAESFAHAAEGIVSVASGRNFRIQAAVGILAIILGIALHISAVEWIVVLFCIGAVLGLESVNTAIEDTIDLSVREIRPQAKRAKDVAAGAVLLMSAFSLVIGVIVFAPKLLFLVV